MIFSLLDRLRNVTWLWLLVLLFLLIGLSWWLYQDTIWLPPIFHHAWAQADWLSLALKFRERGFDFFHPATHNLLTRDGVTGAAFPLPAYLAAILMAVTHSEAPGLMRLLTLGCSLGGLLALGATVYQAKAGVWRAGLAVLFVFFAPVYGYYQASYLPSVPAFAAALGGYYCFYQSRQLSGLPRAGAWLYGAVAWFTLAAAIRTPFAIPLMASLLHLVALPLRRPPNRGRVLLAYTLSGFFLVSYFLYNEYLTRHYGGSMFLARPLPFQSPAEALSSTQEVARKWGLQLLGSTQWFALVAVALLALGNRPLHAWVRSEWAVHWLLLTGGGLTYYVLMGPQYLDHDYYFIDSLFLPLVLLFAGSLVVMPWPSRRMWQLGGTAASVAVASLWARDTRAVQMERYTVHPNDLGYMTLQNFTGSAQLLDSLGVPRSAHITVLDAYTYNLPLILMKRRGWTVLTTNEENLRASFQEPADLIITQNATFRSDVVSNYPLILERLDSVFSNGRLTLWRPRARPVPVVWEAQTDFESPLDTTVWLNSHSLSTEQAASGQQAYYLKETSTFGLTYSRSVGQASLRNQDRLIVRAKCWLPQGEYKALLVASLEPPGGGPAYYWKALDCRRYQAPAGRWTTVGGAFHFPAPRTPHDLLKVYIVKDGATAILLDDVRLTLVR
ncbi:hypothetical protein [Hymenobacter fodinae]|uniref:Glycosyltransferase RgtA/B/C/D-like domain-containing protein n=1 Tax=Hymenobacter fodinae TaxID=2510796 RepID=A0A4Z0P2F4_9BACT|nr:hypothetical protein [Hymenobacter fodinae]TGE04940.1 hypothetical protein EU556_22480 [Hymenobacter fodinae]